jgi:hypothetical protein
MALHDETGGANLPQPGVQLERVAGGHRVRALGAIAAAAALVVFVVVTGRLGQPAATPGARSAVTTTNSGSSAEAGGSVAPSRSNQPDLSFTLPGGLLVIDETHVATPAGPSGSVSTVVAQLAEHSYYAIVGRCYGAGVVAWAINSNQSGVTDSGEILCDGMTHGTGIVTSSGMELPMRLSYDRGISFRFVVTLVQS